MYAWILMENVDWLIYENGLIWMDTTFANMCIFGFEYLMLIVDCLMNDTRQE